MAQPISNLPLGSKVKEINSGENEYKIISHSHFGGNRTLCILEPSGRQVMPIVFTGTPDSYDGCGIDIETLNDFNSFSEDFKNAIVETSLPIQRVTSSGQKSLINITRKLFALSLKEMQNTQDAFAEGTHIPYYSSPTLFPSGNKFWTRSLIQNIENSLSFAALGTTFNPGQFEIVPQNQYRALAYAFNVHGTQQVTDTVQPDGTYHLVFNQPPNKPVINQLNGQTPSADVNNPQIVGPIMQFETTYQDPDSDPLAKINLVVVDLNTSSEVFNQEINTTNPNFTQDLTGIVNAGSQYSMKVRQQDDQGNWSEFSDLIYIQIGETANIPTKVSPLNAVRVALDRKIIATLGSGKPSVNQHFQLRVRKFAYSNAGFTTTPVSDVFIQSKDSQAGWEVSTDGTTYVPLPVGGADSATYSHVRYTPQTDWDDTFAYLYNWYTWDTQYEFYSAPGEKGIFIAGDTLSFETVVTTRTNRPNFTLGVYQGSNETAGNREILVANNANDISPTFEDATATFFTTGYTILNTTKTAADWGYQAKISGTIDENVVSSTPVFITGFAYVARE